MTENRNPAPDPRDPTPSPLPTALVTGASRGLGRAVAQQLVDHGWQLVVDGRDAARLRTTVRDLAGPGAAARVLAVPGDLADAAHRAELVAAVDRLGRLDLLVNNASTLGPVPLRPLGELGIAEVESVFAVNTLAPWALTVALLPWLRRSGGTVLDLSSDAAVAAYPTWAAYSASKAALDRFTAVLGAEEPALRCYAVDPGDMATDLHRQAIPDADPAALADPDRVAAALWRLLETRPPGGRYLAEDLLRDPLGSPA